MITLEQLDELESKIIKALELISDLRTENSRLEAENQKLRDEYEKISQLLEKKEKDISSLKEQLEKANLELGRLKENESVLEKKILQILAKLNSAETNFATKRKDIQDSNVSDKIKDDLTIIEEDSEIEVKLEKPIEKPQLLGLSSKKTDIIESIDQVKEQSNLVREATQVSEMNDDEIIVLDEDEDEIILSDNLENETIIEETADTIIIENREKRSDISSEENYQKDENKETIVAVDDEIILDDDDIGIFELEDDEDFLIIEENENNKPT
ncbi:MAG: hypothetical protein NZ853_04715 [Leptospiraceae bacterium]|nr:hypothetical protein [Leptospiraceae bacterium]MDW7975926.1 hypothetical protein [Leptospiraceae bacterium]